MKRTNRDNTQYVIVALLLFLSHSAVCSVLHKLTVSMIRACSIDRIADFFCYSVLTVFGAIKINEYMLQYLELNAISCEFLCVRYT